MMDEVADNFTLAIPHDTAVYLPAVQPTYAMATNQRIELDRPLPQDFTLDDLEFWSGKSRLWNHMALLHSIGGYSIGATMKGSLFNRGTRSFTFIGDSGGFQIGNGSLTGVKGLASGMAAEDAIAAWKDNYDAKLWIIRWLDRYSDWAMTLDMPLWAMDERGKQSPFHKCTEAQLLQMTQENLKLIEGERGERTRWLNVVQGGEEGSIRRWWDGVKWFRHGGWALAGNAGWHGGIANVLSTILMMRDEDAFVSGQDWLHVLGVSTTYWSVLLTAIQRELRHINPQLQVSYDSASPFIHGGRYDQYVLPPKLGTIPEDWSIKIDRMEGLRAFTDAKSAIKFPVASPLGKRLMMHHLIIDESEFSARRHDTLSNLMMMNHNIWVYLDAARRANAAAFNEGSRRIPHSLATSIDVIAEAFTAADWRSVLKKRKPLLDRVAGPS